MSSERRSPGVSTPWSTIEPRPEAARVTVRLSRQTISAMDALVESGVFASTAEIVREGVRRLLTEQTLGSCSLDELDDRRVFRLPQGMLAGIDAFVEEQPGFTTRSSVIRVGLLASISSYTDVLCRENARV